MDHNGLLTMQSFHSFHDTVERIEQVLLENDVTIFAKIDHSKNAQQADLKLRNTIVLLFGAPHIGTLLMQENQHIGIDLPSKALVWEDADGKVWLSRNQTSWLTERHGIEANATSIALEEKVSKLLHKAAAQ